MLTGTRWTDAIRGAMDAAPTEDSFPSRLRSPSLTTRLGTWLGLCFALAFVTGVWSHVAQLPDPPVPLPTSPVWLYRVSQGVHVAVGTAAVPLLLVKLWSVFPKLVRRPPRQARAALLDGLERLSVLGLVGSAVFQLATGLANSAQWYPWAFSFRRTHFAVAWLAIGFLLVHIAVKLPVIRDNLRVRPTEPDDAARTGLTRRGLLLTTGAAAGVAVVATAVSGVPGLRHASVLAVRSGTGPQGVPVNKSAMAAGVVATAGDPAYRLRLRGPLGEVRLSRADLEAMPQVRASLPIACVEGWSASATWTGVRMRDLVRLVGGTSRSGVRVESLQAAGGSRESRLPADFAADPRTLLALALDGERLSLDHGYPCRVIAPDRPGALQTKWVATLEVEA